MPLARGRTGCLCLLRHSSKGTPIDLVAHSKCFGAVIQRTWVSMSLISTVGIYGGGAASYLYTFRAVYV